MTGGGLEPDLTEDERKTDSHQQSSDHDTRCRKCPINERLPPRPHTSIQEPRTGGSELMVHGGKRASASGARTRGGTPIHLNLKKK